MLTKCIEERSERAIRFMNQHGFQVVNRNGQRVSSNRTNLPELQQPDKPYTEVFLGKVPRDLFEDELLPVLLQVGGVIKKIRYMMDFSGYNRGFAFVKFTTTTDAASACKLLDGRALRPNVAPIGARISFDNKCLYFGNLPLNCSANQLVRALRKIDVPGVVGARMADSIATGAGHIQAHTDKYHQHKHHHHHHHYQINNSRLAPPPPTERFCHVEFESHEAATIARRMLLPSEVRIFGRKITIDWTRSEIPHDLQVQLRSPAPINMSPPMSFNNLPRKIVPYFMANAINAPNKLHSSMSINPFNNHPSLHQRANRRTASDVSNNSGSNSSLNSNTTTTTTTTQRFCTEWHPLMANQLHNGYNFINNKAY